MLAGYPVVWSAGIGVGPGLGCPRLSPKAMGKGPVFMFTMVALK